METIEKLGEIINCVINGKSLKKVEINDDERVALKSLFDEVTFLYCYPKDNQLYNLEYLKKAFEENLFFENVYIKNTSSYAKLMNNKELKKNVEDLGSYDTICLNNDLDKMNVINRHELYLREGDVVKKFIEIKGNDKQCFRISFKDYAKGFAPFEISSENMKKLIGNGEAIELPDNNVIVKAKSSVVGLRWLDNSKQKEFSDRGLIYKPYKNKYVYDQFLEEGVYDIVEEIKNKQTSFTILNKEGKTFSKEELFYDKIIKKMRDAISHDNVYYYKLYAGQKNVFPGKIFLLKSKDDDEEKFKCVVICINLLIEPLSLCNCFNFNPEKNILRFVVVPYLKNKISTKNQAQELQDKIKLVSIKINQEVDYVYFIDYVEETILSYSIIQQNAPELIDFLNKRIKEKFPYVEIKLEEISNFDLLNNKCLNNKNLLTVNLKENHMQEIYLKNVLTFYYGADCLSKNWCENVPFLQRIQLQKKGVQDISYNLFNLVDKINDKEKNLYKNAQVMRLFGGELKIFYLMVLIYANLIKNSFAEDLERKDKNFYIGKEDVSKVLENKTKEQKIYDMDMSMFKIYPDNDERLKKSPTNDKKVSVLKWIKNALCHNGIYLKAPLNNNIDNQILIFKSESEFKNKQNGKIKKIVNTVETKVEDLINFLLKPIFKDYVSDTHDIIQAKTFDELVEIAIKLLNKDD